MCVCVCAGVCVLFVRCLRWQWQWLLMPRIHTSCELCEGAHDEHDEELPERYICCIHIHMSVHMGVVCVCVCVCIIEYQFSVCARTRAATATAASEGSQSFINVGGTRPVGLLFVDLAAKAGGVGEWKVCVI